jgi:6-phosphogluconate dehydrogenase, C-terminal domain
MKRGLGMHENEISEVFARWNKGVLDSFLIEITTDILKYNDKDGVPLVTKIKDSAGQKVPSPHPNLCWGEVNGIGNWKVDCDQCTRSWTTGNFDRGSRVRAMSLVDS